MCTRFYIEKSEELTPYIDAAGSSSLAQRMENILSKSFKNEGEIRPTDIAAVIAPSSNGKKTVYPMVWGYHLDGMRQPIVNARIETAKEKKTFSEDWQKHRCIIPAAY